MLTIDIRHRFWPLYVGLAMVIPAIAWAMDIPPVSDADYYDDGKPAAAEVELGRLLFFDKLLSGNRNISCATCHHPSQQTGDALSLSVGEGGTGLGNERGGGYGSQTILARVGRNAQPLFNVGAREFRVLFHDGRVESDPRAPGKMRTPIGERLPDGLDNVLAAQALFPVVSMDEMAGQRGENEIADAVSVADVELAWALLEERIRNVPGYVDRFVSVYDHVDSADDIRIVDVGNAIAAFTTVELRADNSRFDAWLRGDSDALTPREQHGMNLFYGDAGCADCHSGVFQTDHRFHAIAMPQIGPGKGHGFDGHDDFGREFVTGNPADRYRFRTPSLRNVTLTGPWGHSGAYESLDDVVRHHLDPVNALHGYKRDAALAPSRPDLDGRDFLVQGNPARREAIAARNELQPRNLSDKQVEDLVAFLDTLTDVGMTGDESRVPETVPSGLPVVD